MKLVAWLAWALYVALAQGGDNYLSASDSWEVSYTLAPIIGCNSTKSLFPHNLTELISVVRNLQKGDALMCEMALWVVAKSNLIYPGIVYDIHGNRTPIAAVGNVTARKIFGITDVERGSLWTLQANMSSQFERLVIRANLDTKEATATNPANLTSWIPLSIVSGSGSIHGLPRSIRGQFQLAGIDERPVLRFPGFLVPDGDLTPRLPDPEKETPGPTTLTFFTSLKKESNLTEAKEAWEVVYSVNPLCILYYPVKENCTEVTSLETVKACVKKFKDCPVDIVATLRMFRYYDGLVYDGNNSTTPAAAISKKVLGQRLPQLVPTVEWKLMTVGFVGWDQLDVGGTETCLRGNGLAYKKAIPLTLPTQTNPLTFKDWNNDSFHFVEARTDNFRDGFFRAVRLEEFTTDSDFTFAVMQKEGSRCDWRQEASIMTLSYGIQQSNYIAEKDNWGHRYSLVTSGKCKLSTPPVCNEVADGGSNLTLCVERMLGLDPTCVFEIRLVLLQRSGFHGICVEEDGTRAPVIAIGKNITKKFFESPLKNYSFIYLEAVNFMGTVQAMDSDAACDEWDSRDSLLFRNSLDVDLPTPRNPANLSDGTWKDAPRPRPLVINKVGAKLDPNADFSITTRPVSGRGCLATQQGASLNLTIPVRLNSTSFTQAADSWVGVYELRVPGSPTKAVHDCTDNIFMLKEDFYDCVKNISKDNPTGQIILRAFQNLVYPGLKTSKGSTGAIAITPTALKRIQDVKPYPGNKVHLGFGGNFFDCRLDNASVLFFPQYNTSDLVMKDGKLLPQFKYDGSDDKLFVAIENATVLQAGTYVLNPPRPNCEWSVTSGFVLLESNLSFPIGEYTTTSVKPTSTKLVTTNTTSVTTTPTRTPTKLVTTNTTSVTTTPTTTRRR